MSSKKFRFHALGLPHTVTHQDYCACAFTMKVLKFCKMMKERGHHVIHYGHEDSDVACDEHVTLTTNSDLEKAYGSYDWRKDFFKHSTADHCHIEFNKRGLIEVEKRLKAHDFVLAFWGQGHADIAEYCNKLGNCIVVEPGIGYNNASLKYRVYESYAVMHYTLGLQNKSPSWYDVVIPNYFDPDDFDFSDKKGDYFLCLGRILPCKGIHIAIQASEKLNVKLKIGGQGDICENLGYVSIPENVEYVGYADREKRRNLLKNAKAVILLSDYVEPFGGITIEALLSGTPIITSDWGVFAETNIQGITGYRCRTFEQITWAMKNISNINPHNCRNWAINNYSCDKVATMYEEYFDQLSNLWNEGWYTENPNRNSLDWLSREYNFVETKKKPSIAIWCSPVWSFGRLYGGILKYLSNFYDFTYYDWGSIDDTASLLNNKWTDHDIILTNTCILRNEIVEQYKSYSCCNGKKLCSDFKIKLMVTVHSNCNDKGFFSEHFDEEYGNSITMTGVSREICSQLNVPFTPSGVDIEIFNFIKNISQIKILGFIGNYEGKINEVKRPEMFEEIVHKTSLNKLFIHSRPLSNGKAIYEDIDMLVYTSLSEGGPLGVFEAAACGIPVISTKVGNVHELKTIKTFETVDEAVDIINHFNKNTDELEKYIKDLSEEVIQNWDWNVIGSKYWIPNIQANILGYEK